MMRGILQDSYAEMVNRKILVIIGVVTVIASLVALSMSFVDLPLSAKDIDSGDSFAFGILQFLDIYLTILVTFVLFAVAGLFPAMMQKGRADFYLSKPISRHALFTYRFTSVYIVYGCLIFFSGLISYTVFAISAGVSGFSVVWVTGIELLIFFLWLSVVTLAGVLFNSGGVPIMIAFSLWIAQLLLQGYENLKVFDSDIPYYIGKVLYYIVPKTSQLGQIGVNIAANRPIESWVPLWSSALFALVVFWLALILFRRKDY